ncbi:hypothetical protein VU07_05230, partial [Desulfobulbus sp. F4]|nr:hypothetical protein [Desulfobulbus sp. F4]
KYLDEFGKLAKANNTMIVPGNLTDVAGMVATAMTTLRQTSKTAVPMPAARPDAHPERTVAAR